MGRSEIILSWIFQLPRTFQNDPAVPRTYFAVAQKWYHFPEVVHHFLEVAHHFSEVVTKKCVFCQEDVTKADVAVQGDQK